MSCQWLERARALCSRGGVRRGRCGRAESSLRQAWRWVMHTFRSRQDTIDLSLVFIVVAMLVAAPCSPGYAQQQVGTRFRYAAKVLCMLGVDVGFGCGLAAGGCRW